MAQRFNYPNWYTKLGAEQLSSWLEDMDDSIFNRFNTFIESYGIISDTDPRDVEIPWKVEIDGTTITVNEGKAITSSGIFISIEEPMELSMPFSYSIPSTWLIVAEGVTVDSTENQLNDFGELDPVTYVATTRLSVVSTNLWNDSSIWSSERKFNAIVVNLLLAGEVSGASVITVDFSSDDYDNRPWFSIKDIEHRSQLGTGDASVPHSLSLSDLSEGEITIYNQLKNHGFVLAPPVDVNNIGGNLCTSTLVPSDFSTDSTGEITGHVNAEYAYLPQYPYRLVSVKNTSADPVALQLLKKTNIVFLLSGDIIPASGMTVEYTKVDSLAPKVNFSSHRIDFKQSSEKEIVVSKGQSTIVEEDYYFDVLDLGPMPFKWVLYWNGSSIVSNMNSLNCSSLLEDIGTEEQTLNLGFEEPTSLVVGLNKATLNPSLSIKIKITGLDKDGNTVVEEVNFNNTTYNPSSISSSTIMDHSSGSYTGTPGNYIRTETKWSEITKWMITERINDGLQSVVNLFTEINTENLLPLVTLYFDGNSIQDLRDERIIYKKLTNNRNLTEFNLKTAQKTYNLNYASAELGYYDDIEDLYYVDYKDSDYLERVPWYSKHEVLSYPDTDYFVTQALNISELSISGPSGLLIFGEDVSVEIRGVSTTTPSVWDSWVSIPLNANGLYNIGAILFYNWFKIQFRFQASSLKGWGIIGISV